MYCDYYGFREKPFNITPDPGFIFLSSQHREAFAHLLYGIDNHIGFISLTGEIGTGKTTVIRTLLTQLANDKYRTALIFNPCLSSVGLMQHIVREYGIEPDGCDMAELLHRLNEFLLRENAAGRTVVLVVDEAQNLDPAVLEQIRLISNLETERDKLIQIVLVGQPELRDLLHRPELRQLGQRIGVTYHLQPMNHEDTQAYINHRIEIAGRRDLSLFTPGASRRIFRHSGGYPRVINLVCDRALLLGYTRGSVPITASMAKTAISDIGRRQTPRSKSGLIRSLLMIGGVGLAVAAAFAVFRHQPPPPPRVQPSVSRLVSELGKMEEAASSVQAFNEVGKIVKLPPVAGTPQRWSPDELARDRGLDCYRVSGPAPTIFRFGTPIVVEVALPGSQGRRYVAITGTDATDAALAPAVAGIRQVKLGELTQHLTGKGYIVWKNYLEIPPNLKPGSRGEHVRRLQGLLKGTGTYSARLNGAYDRNTVTAVKKFQQANGIEETGSVGPQTLMLLYRGSGATYSTLTRETNS